MSIIIGRHRILRSFLLKRCVRHFSATHSLYRRREEIDFDEPIKFSTSKASQPERPPWMSNPSLLPAGQPPKYQATSIYISFIALLLYFCVLRKENDLDDLIFANSLYSKVDGLEKEDLLAALNNAAATGRDTRTIRKRLKQIEDEEAHTKTN